ncbi:type IV conjugative transfer system protein TraE [Providencia sp. wls1919]|nr:type IV conjugative transfer system protein TraE [Providencia sp. wls1919]
MEHQAKLNTNRIISIAFIFVVLLMVLSLIVNIKQAFNNDRLQTEQKIVMVPMLFNTAMGVSENSSDPSYLEAMATSFVALRLNISALTVDASHEALLTKVKPLAHNELKMVLLKEAKKVKDNDINSAFYITSLRVYPSEQRVDIKGELRTWIGGSDKPLKDFKHYALYMERESGVTWLSKFVEVKEE